MRLLYRLREMAAKLSLKGLLATGIYESYFGQWRNDFFDYAEKNGVHILPVHYYTPIPTKPDQQRARRANSMAGIELDITAGAARASRLIEKYQTDLKFLNGSPEFDPSNQALHPLDAALLYGSIRDARPKRIIEIGSGHSTLVISKALKDEGCNTQFTCIEPFIPDYLKPTPYGVSEIIEKTLQEVPGSCFTELHANDILFIDSTHVVRYDSDVVYEILEILPSLNPGVIVHVHDIFLPDDYPELWLSQSRFFWNEQYMLQAFLSMNPFFKIEIPVHAIKSMLSDEAAYIVPLQNSVVSPNSLWMRKLSGASGRILHSQ